MNPVMTMLVSWSAVLVCAVFALIVVTTYWPGRRAYFDKQAAIPLRDGNPDRTS
jgi:cbb3-type cytochrome oxidase subunit 3